MGGNHLLHRGKVGRENHIVPHKQDCGKIQLKPRHRDLLQPQIIFTVENPCNRIRLQENSRIEQNRQHRHGVQGPGQKRALGLFIPLPILPADKRLDSLGDARIHSGDHQGQIGHHPVGRHPGISRKAQNNRIEHDDHDPRGELGQQRGEAQGQVISHMCS